MRKKINKLILGLFLFGISVSMSVVSANAAETDGCENVTQEYTAEEAKDYIAGKNTYPTKDGYLFAGWYTTDAIPADDTAALKYAIQSDVPNNVEKVYALFVPVHVLDVKAQISSNLMNNMTTETSGSIRFVTTINTLLYKQVGFDISYVNSSGTEKNATSSSNKVYKKLYAVGTNEEDKTYVPTDFCAVSTYFKACTINNIPNANFATPFEIRPFWVTLDGSKVYGETVIKSIDDYLLAQDVYVSTVGDDANTGTEAAPVQTLNCALGKVKNQGTVHIVDSYATTTDFVWEKHNKTVNITGGTIDFTSLPEKELRAAQGTDTEDTSDDVAAVTANVLDVYDSVTFKNTKLTFANGQHVYANGNTVEITSDVTWGNTSAYIQIYGGAHSAALESDTNLILGAGQYTRVFGGGNYDSPLTGDVNVTLSGSINPNVDPATHNRDYAVFGGGVNKSKVEGDINLKILDETVRFRHVYGGGEWNAVEGDIYVTFAGSAFSLYGGGYATTVTGDIYLTMTGGWTEQIFGGCNGKSMTGNTNVNVLGGTVERRIYGGCYNDYKNYGNVLFPDYQWVAVHDDKAPYQVNGHTNVTISPNATLTLNYKDPDWDVKVDNSIYSISRYKEVLSSEWGAFIFNVNSYNDTYDSKLGYIDTTHKNSFASKTHHYLITTNGNTADGSLGTVSSEGDYLRIKPRRGYSAVVAVEGQQKHYTESETVFKLPELTEKDETKNITVTFAAIDSSVDKSGYHARIDGAYYDTIEEAVAVASVLDSKETVTVTVLQDVEVAAQMNIVSKVTIQNEPGQDITIYRGSGLDATDMFNVTSTGTLTLAGVEDRNSLVFDGRTKEEAEANTSSVNAVGSTGSLIEVTGNLNVQNITIQYAKRTGNKASGAYGGAINIVSANNKLSIADSTFSNNFVGYRGGAIFATGARSQAISISGCTFENNTASDAGGAICVASKNTLNIADTTFVGNEALGNFGGAVAMGSDESTVNLSGNVTFDDNHANGTGYGGGAIMTGSVLGIAENADVTLKNNTASNLGGGIYYNAKNTPEFVLGEGAVLTMSGNTDKNGDVNIAVKANMLQEGDRFVNGNNEEKTIAEVVVGTVTYNVDANGYLTRIVQLRHEETITKYATLQEALEQAVDGDTIALLDNITLNDQLTLSKSVTITTDGVADRTIYCGTGAVADNVIAITGTGISVTFNGTENSRLIFDGTDVSLTTSFISAESGTAESVTMQYVTMQNISSADSGAAVYTEVPLNITDCKFKACTSTGSGGAIYCAADLTVQQSEFTTCTVSNEGGAIYAINNYTVNISDSTFIENTSTGNRGGAICVGTKRSNPIDISGCTFESNTAKTNGGAIRISAENTLNITDSNFDGNKATTEFGGAIAMGTSGSTLNLYGTCIFSDNQSSVKKHGGGGAIFAPKKLNIKVGAWIEMSGNNCTDSIGDAICVQTFVSDTNKGTVADSLFVVEEGAALYVYDNTAEENNSFDDICITDGTSLTETENTGFTVNGSFGAWKPVAKIGNVGYETLQSAVDSVDDGGEIQLISDVTLNAQLTISKSVTITTDGKANRTIYCGAGATTTNVIVVNAPEKEITFKGISATSQLIFDGNSASEEQVTLKQAFIRVEDALNLELQYVAMQNINSGCEFGTAISSTKELKVEHCMFRQCKTTNTSGKGGAVFTSAKAEFTKCKFEGCKSEYRGGAIYSRATMTITDCTFGDGTEEGGNTAKAGGAILVQYANTLNIEQSTFIKNKATADFGGAVGFSTPGASLNLSGTCVFSGNEANGNTNYRGGAIFAPVNFTIEKDAQIKIYGNKCTGQTKGGAICLYVDSASAANVTINKNAAVYVYDNLSMNDEDNDICIKGGETFAISNIKGEGTYSTTAPDTTE